MYKTKQHNSLIGKKKKKRDKHDHFDQSDQNEHNRKKPCNLVDDATELKAVKTKLPPHMKT